jgi:myxalamid-type polyketide synthase MxaE and MxaD
LLPPQVLDSALHALAVLAAEEPVKGAVQARLPALIRSVRVLGRPPERCACHASLEEGGEPGSLVGQVRLYGEDGSLAVEVEGLVLRLPGEAASARGWARERLYSVRWEERSRPPTPSSASPPGRPWLWLASEASAARGILSAVKSLGRSDLVAAWPRGDAPQLLADPAGAGTAPARADGWAELLDRAGVERAVWLTPPLQPEELSQECERVLELCRGVIRSRSSKVMLATCEAHGAVPDAAHAGLWGLGRVLAREHPDRWGGLLDLPRAWLTSPDRAVATALESADAEVSASGTRPLEPRLQRASLPPPSGRSPFRAEATYVLSGGLGGLGLALCRWMVDQGARHLLLLSRSPPGAEASAAIAALEGSGAKVRALQADVAVPDDVARALERPSSLGWPEVKGVFHLAAVLADGILETLDGPRLRTALGPKVGGAWNLHLATRGLALEHFVLFSSIAALGTAGQGAYAAGNAFLDALARRRRAEGLPALSIGWGAFAEAGMAARLEAQGRRGASGVEPMPPGRAFDALGAALDSREPHLIIAGVRWSAFAEGVSPGARRLYSSLVEVASPSPEQDTAGAGPGSPSWLRSQPLRARRELLEVRLREQVARILGLEPEQAPARDQPLMQAGLDSLMTVQLRNTLRSSLQLDLPVTLLFDHPTIARLAEHLAGMLEAPGPAAASAPAAPAAPAASPAALTAETPADPLEALLTELEQLSEEEVERRLRGEGSGTFARR